jgi:predicted nuclease with TOPRIM domain
MYPHLTQAKLKTLLTNIRSNQEANSKVNEEEAEVDKLRKEKRRWELDVEHQASALNALIAENNRLKEQVNVERGKRVVYFNVYKNLEREIHEW